VQGFLSVDPLAEDYASWSPYNYVLGNPVMLVDPDGKAPECRICKSLIKTVVNSARKGKLDLSEVYDIADNTVTLFSPKSTLFERGEAAFNLVSPISTKEAKKAKSFLKGKNNKNVVSAEEMKKIKGGSGINFSESARASANKLGFDPDDVVIKGGVADIPIIFTSEVKLSDISKVTKSLKSSGATSAKINTGPIINGSVSSRIEKAHNSGKTFLGFNIKKTGDPDNMFILEKAL